MFEVTIIAVRYCEIWKFLSNDGLFAIDSCFSLADTRITKNALKSAT